MSTAPTTPGFEPFTRLVTGGPYVLTDGTVIKPLLGLVGYLRALNDAGVQYVRDTTVPNVLAFQFRADTGVSWATRYVVQYPKFDIGDPEDPYIKFALASFDSWPNLTCVVDEGGTRDIWPLEVKTLLAAGKSACRVNLITGRVEEIVASDVDEPDTTEHWTTLIDGAGQSVPPSALTEDPADVSEWRAAGSY